MLSVYVRYEHYERFTYRYEYVYFTCPYHDMLHNLPYSTKLAPKSPSKLVTLTRLERTIYPPILLIVGEVDL